MLSVLPDALYDVLRRFPAGDATFVVSVWILCTMWMLTCVCRRSCFLQISDRRHNRHDSHTGADASDYKSTGQRWCVDVGNLQGVGRSHAKKGGFAMGAGDTRGSSGRWGEPAPALQGKENRRLR